MIKFSLGAMVTNPTTLLAALAGVDSALLVGPNAVLFSDTDLISNANFETSYRTPSAAILTTGLGGSEEGGLLRMLEEQATEPLVREEYRGISVLTDAANGITVAVMEHDIVVWGTRTLVRAAIDVSVGATDSSSGQLRGIYEELDVGWFRMAMNIPEDRPDAIVGVFTRTEAGYPAYGSMGFSYDYDTDADRHSATLKLDYTDRDAAERDAALMENHTWLGELADHKPFRDFFGNLEVSLHTANDGTRVIVSLNGTTGQIAAAIMGSPLFGFPFVGK